MVWLHGSAQGGRVCRIYVFIGFEVGRIFLKTLGKYTQILLVTRASACWLVTEAPARERPAGFCFFFSTGPSVVKVHFCLYFSYFFSFGSCDGIFSLFHLFQWNNLFCVRVVKLDLTEQILIFVLMKFFYSNVTICYIGTIIICSSGTVYSNHVNARGRRA